MRLRIIEIISVLLALSACSVSPKSNIYLLKAIEPVQAKLVAQKPISIYLQSVNFPDYLDRPQMVLRKDSMTLDVEQFQRWGEPLNISFERVFRGNLERRLAPAKVLSKKIFSAMAFDYQLAIDVSRFDTDAQQQAILQLNWVILNSSGDKILFSSQEVIIVPMKADNFQARVEAQSVAVAILADKVAVQLRGIE